MDPTSGAASLHCWPSRHTQLGSHTRALQSLPHMLVLFKYTWKSERFGLEYTAVPFPTERDGGIRKVLWGYTIIWWQVREDSSPESPTWVLAGHWEVGRTHYWIQAYWAFHGPRPWRKPPSLLLLIPFWHTHSKPPACCLIPNCASIHF